MSSMIKALSFQLNYVKLYRRSIKLICLRNNRSSKEKRILTLDFWWVFFWMTWRIQLEASCLRRETRLNEVCFLWMSWILVDFSWVNERLYCFLWADKKLSYFLQVNWELNYFLWANWKLSYFFQVNEKLNYFLQANWVLNCFLWAICKLNCFLWVICRLNCFLWMIHELSCFLWMNWERDWKKATLLTSNEKFSSC